MDGQGEEGDRQVTELLARGALGVAQIDHRGEVPAHGLVDGQEEIGEADLVSPGEGLAAPNGSQELVRGGARGGGPELVYRVARALSVFLPEA